MKLIPNYINETSPSGEKRVFYLFKDLNQDKYKDWVVYHSLNYPVEIQKKDKSIFKYFGETDFLIFIPNKGLINIEIKGGRIFTRDGNWFTQNRSGESRLKKSPFVQATDSMKNIERYLAAINIHIPQAFLVVFPDCDFHQDSIEWSEDNLCSGNLDQFLLKKISHLENNYLIQSGGRFYPKLDEQKKLKKLFRSNFECYQSYHSLLKQSIREINKFTEEQIDILDQFETNKMLIEGGQGTGKTVVAVEIAKKKVFEGKNVLFLNSNRLACENIKTKLNDILENKKNQIHINTYFGYIKNNSSKYFASLKSVNDTSNTEYIKAEQSTFYEQNNIYTKYLLNKIINDDFFVQYDCIVLDEIQNYYYYEQFYDLLDCLLKDGLKKGSWYFFGDFQFQKLFVLHEELSDEELENRHPKNNLKEFGYYNQRLTHNVRNAAEICVQAPIVSNVSDKHPSIYKNTPGEIHHYFADNKKKEIQILEGIIEKLHKNQINGSDITILSPFRLDNDNNLLKSCDISKFYKIINLNKINNFGEEIVSKRNDKNSIYFSTTQYFQGMENKIIILTDPMTSVFGTSKTKDRIIKNENLKERYPENFLTFNAMGRANSILYIIWDKVFEKYVFEKKAESIALIK